MININLEQEFEGTIKEFGDFQTPKRLAKDICKILINKGITPSLVVEPTCGEGIFITEVLNSFDSIKKIYGVEIQRNYIEKCYENIKSVSRGNLEVSLFHSNFFEHKFNDINIDENTLFIGNPPWVTNSELTEKTGWNLPVKSNFKLLTGLDAMTGKANFDITEAIIIHLLNRMDIVKKGILAMLCKKTVIKNILEFQKKRNWNIIEFEAYEIDAKKEFNVSVEAALLYVKFGEVGETLYQCNYYNIDNPDISIYKMGWIDDKFVSNINLYEENALQVDGKSEFIWRSGLKHDAAKIMELQVVDKVLRNGLKEEVNLEEDLLYSLMKGSDVANERFERLGDRKIIVTQKKVGQDTKYIAEKYPKLSNYLKKHAEILDNRKSSIYRNKPRFSVFGVGDYSFMPYKVAIASMYKSPKFVLIGPDSNDKSVVLDDTCYFLGFSNYEEAVIVAVILNSDIIKLFLKTIVFKDAQRVYTKQVLMRINFLNSIEVIGIETILKKIDEEYNLQLTQESVKDFIDKYLATQRQVDLFS